MRNRQPQLSAAAAALLETVLATDGERAAAAFTRWSALTDIEQLPADQFALLPAAVAYWQSAGGTPDARLAGVVRRAKVRRLQAISEGEQVLRGLQQAGLAAQPFGRLALLRLPGEQFAHDALERLDVLVAATERPAAVAALTADGWQIRGGAADDVAVRWGATLLLRHPVRPLPLYLSWRLTPDGPPYTADAARSLTPAELVLVALATARRGGMHGLRALADTALLLRGADDTAWAELLTLCGAYLAAADLLMADRLLQPIGVTILTSVQHTLLTQQAQRQLSAAPWQIGQREELLQRLQRHRATWRRLCRSAGVAATPLSLFDYLAGVRRSGLRAV